MCSAPTLCPPCRLPSHPPNTPTTHNLPPRLQDCPLPHAGYGHVILGKPSPFLFYPISKTEASAGYGLSLVLMRWMAGSGAVEWVGESVLPPWIVMLGAQPPKLRQVPAFVV